MGGIAGAPATAWGDPRALLARMEDTFRKAGQSDVVIHTVSLSGITGAVDTSSLSAVASDSRGDQSARRSGHPFTETSGRGTLITMARSTGGRFIPPTNDFGKAFAEVDRISRHSYVLAFESGAGIAKPESLRSVKVRVRRPGLSVSHRSSYATAPLPASDAAGLQLQAAEAISKGLSGGALRLRLTTLPYRDRDGKLSVHASLQIDGPELAAAVRGPKLAVRIYGYMMGGGRVLDSQVLDTALDLDKFGDAVRRSGFRVLTAFPVSPGVADLRFFVSTGLPGLTGSIQRNVMAPAFIEGEPALSAPMFAVPLAGHAVILSQASDRPRLEIPFRLGSEPFLPDAFGALKPGSARDLCVFVWRARQGSLPPLEVTGEIARRGEPPLNLPIEGAPRVVTDTDGFDRYVITVLAPEAPPGAYTLRLTFRDPSAGLITSSETVISLEK